MDIPEHIWSTLPHGRAFLLVALLRINNSLLSAAMV